MSELNDSWFKNHGFDTTKEPFVNESGNLVVYKNYIRDTSGKYRGYIVEHKISTAVTTVEDLVNLKRCGRTEVMPKVLHMTLKKKWFDLIAKGEKTTEFREAKPYWDSRLTHGECFKKFDEVHFTNGYGKDKPFMRLEFKECLLLASSNNYYCKHGEYFPMEKYAVLLGDVLELRNYGA